MRSKRAHENINISNYRSISVQVLRAVVDMDATFSSMNRPILFKPMELEHFSKARIVATMGSHFPPLASFPHSCRNLCSSLIVLECDFNARCDSDGAIPDSVVQFLLSTHLGMPATATL